MRPPSDEMSGGGRPYYNNVYPIWENQLRCRDDFLQIRFSQK